MGSPHRDDHLQILGVTVSSMTRTTQPSAQRSAIAQFIQYCNTCLAYLWLEPLHWEGSERHTASHRHVHHSDRPDARLGRRCSSAGHRPAGLRFECRPLVAGILGFLMASGASGTVQYSTCALL